MKLSKNIALLLVLLVSVVSMGCDSNDNDGGDLGDIIGDWQQVENDPEIDAFVRISTSEVVVAATSSDLPGIAVCSVFDVGGYDSNLERISIVDSDGVEEASSIRRDGDRLIIDGDAYERTGDFPACTATI